MKLFNVLSKVCTIVNRNEDEYSAKTYCRAGCQFLKISSEYKVTQTGE
jgi:hypothetical protein